MKVKILGTGTCVPSITGARVAPSTSKAVGATPSRS